jgi:hypothetical protein
MLLIEVIHARQAMMQKERACVKMRIANKIRPFPGATNAKKPFSHTLTFCQLVKKVARGSNYSNRNSEMPIIVQKRGVFSC